MLEKIKMDVDGLNQIVHMNLLHGENETSERAASHA